jgi:hypothetical protein
LAYDRRARHTTPGSRLDCHSFALFGRGHVHHGKIWIQRFQKLFPFLDRSLRTSGKLVSHELASFFQFLIEEFPLTEVMSEVEVDVYCFLRRELFGHSGLLEVSLYENPVALTRIGIDSENKDRVTTFCVVPQMLRVHADANFPVFGFGTPPFDLDPKMPSSGFTVLRYFDHEVEKDVRALLSRPPASRQPKLEFEFALLPGDLRVTDGGVIVWGALFVCHSCSMSLNGSLNQEVTALLISLRSGTRRCFLGGCGKSTIDLSECDEVFTKLENAWSNSSAQEWIDEPSCHVVPDVRVTPAIGLSGFLYLGMFFSIEPGPLFGRSEDRNYFLLERGDRIISMEPKYNPDYFEAYQQSCSTGTTAHYEFQPAGAHLWALPQRGELAQLQKSR